MPSLKETATFFAHIAATARYDSPAGGYEANGFCAEFSYDESEDLLSISISHAGNHTGNHAFYVFSKDDLPGNQITEQTFRNLINAEIRYHADHLKDLTIFH